jgi:hypothetical protein
VSGRETVVSLTVSAGGDAQVNCWVYPAQGPILSLDAGRTSLTISTAGSREMPAESVAFARTLAREAQRFVAECERMHAAMCGQVPDAVTPAAGDAA